jgi:hypothetical protein
MTADQTCDIVRKIESRGDILLIPPDSQTAGSINVTQVGGNSGVKLGTHLNFPLPAPVPSPFKVRDIVEINIQSDGSSCEYVQLLEPAP